MPIYEYECMECSKIEEAIQKFSDRPLNKCNHCSGKLQKLVSHSSFHLKGTGWYVTDYANKPNSASSHSRNEETSSSETSSTDKTAKASTTDTKKDTDTKKAANKASE